jgi:hypothetical protein
MIESISMGKLLFKGKVSRSDTIVFKDKMDTKWWIKERNSIQMCDLESVMAVNPEVIVFGTGFMLPISMSIETQKEIKRKGIELIIEKSEEAMEIFNSKVKDKETVGLFHLI